MFIEFTKRLGLTYVLGLEKPKKQAEFEIECDYETISKNENPKVQLSSEQMIKRINELKKEIDELKKKIQILKNLSILLLIQN